MNKWIGIGNLTRDPELSETPNGTAVCKFTVAVNRNFTNANGERECDFINVVAWRSLAENCGRFLSKGKKVSVVGSLQTRSYESNGEKKYVTEIMADEVEFLSPKDEDNHQSQRQPQQGGQRDNQQRRRPALQAFDDDGDIPF
jgi:single-strand DNA-binding protein